MKTLFKLLKNTFLTICVVYTLFSAALSVWMIQSTDFLDQVDTAVQEDIRKRMLDDSGYQSPW